MFNPSPPFIATPYGSSNPNASNPLSPTTQAQLAARASGSTTALSGQMTPEELARIDKYLADITEMWKASSGWARIQLEAQMKDAQKGRDNAYKIAELQAKTQRYGTDQSTMVQLRQLEQQQRQFEANHGLEMAKAYTQYASTPDQAFAMADFKNALGRVSQGYSPAPMAETGTPKAKTWEDFQSLSKYGGGGGSAAGGASASGGGAVPDARLKAMKAVGEAMPPSDTPGNDEQDWEAIRAIQALYSAGRPGEVERLGAPRRAIAHAGLRRAGADPAAVEHERMRGLPGQGSVRAA